MRLCLALGGEELDLEVEAGEAATVGELVAALAGDGTTTGTATMLTVDGAPVEPGRRLVEAGLYDGAVVALAGVPVLVPAGSVGSPDPIAGPHPEPPPLTDHTWWRPPRAAPPPAAPLVEPAADPPLVGEPAALSWPTLVAPAAVAVALAVLLDPRLAAIALVGPVAQLATWLDDRRRLRRRRSDADAFRTAEADRVRREDAAAAALAGARELHSTPHVGELAGWPEARHDRLWERRTGDADFLRLRGLPAATAASKVIGIDGERFAALAVARNLVVQAAALHGPADLGVTIAAGPDESRDWDWAKWLPHLRAAAGHAFVVVDVADPGQARAVIHDARHAALVVVIGHAGVPLPDACRAVIDAHDPSAEGLDAATARRAARALAPLRDPDAVHTTDRGGPVRLLPLLPELEAITRKFRALLPQVRLGTAADGRPFVIDLARDGPHVLIAGTTGSGKSELLRVLVVSLAASMPPEALNFVLLDYKGGSAFDACARLPHTAGLVTDLDDHLAARALRCLRAELRHRERELRATATADIDAHNLRRRAADAALMPRLVIVIDEFAALADDVPTFVPALVDIAQRGRSLGVHLVLATQRPAGVVSDAIRANVGLRIALRVADAGESTDVIGVPDAAGIPADRPGRALARLDAGRVVAFDTPLVSCPHEPDRPAVRVRPFVLNDLQAERRSEDGRDGREEGGRTDLDVLVERIARSARQRGAPSPRCPWPHPLPPEVTWATLGPAAPAHVPLGLVDDPDHQVRRVYTWPQSNLLACGAAGSGAVDAVATLAYALASRPGGGDVHVYALDGAARPLAGLGALPHTGAVIEDHDAERRRRLLRILGDRVDNAARGAPMVLLAIAEMTALFAALDDPASPRARELLVRIIADGPAAGVFTAAAVTRPAAVPPAIAAGFATRLVFRLADPHDASLLGVRPPPPNAPPGRAVDVGSGLEVQMAAPEPPGAAVTERPAAPPPPVSILSASINWATGVAPAAASPPGPGVWLPIGIGDDTLEPCGLLLGDGDHVVVAGGPRTGKTGLLATIARAAASAGVAVTADVAAARAASGHRLCLLVVDDADLIDDANGEVAALLGCRPSSVHVVAAARTERLRGAYGHWTRELRGARHGVLLGPRPDDGDVFGLVLPRTTAPFPPGRGYLITNGIPQLFQAASV